MAKRKSSKNRARHIKHAGVVGGIMGTVAKIMLDPKTERHGSTASALHWLVGEPNMPLGERISRAQEVAVKNMKDLDTYYPIVGGAVMTAAPRLPLIKIVAAPVNTQIRAMTRGRWGL